MHGQNDIKSELFHTFKGFVTYLHAGIPSCNTQSSAFQMPFNVAVLSVYKQE